MTHENAPTAITAVWKTDFQSQEEKLIVVHLASKHEMGEKYSSSWKPVTDFLTQFEEKWCTLSDLASKTHISKVKMTRNLGTLVEKGYINESTKDGKRFKDGKETSLEPIYSLTKKVFEDFV
tara:strand:- start:741 stop:1106 length:366 start_codon:yes stop_codon:yes gene_type:complete